MMKFSNFKTTFSKGVTVPSLIFIIAVCVLSAVFPKLTEGILNNVKEFIFVKLNWVYVWSVTIFVLFLFTLCLASTEISGWAEMTANLNILFLMDIHAVCCRYGNWVNVL